MKKQILYFDCFSGISGDMTIGALLDLGIDKEKFLSELKKINLDEFSVEIKPGIKKGITGTDFTVHLTNPIHEQLHDHEHDHNREHQHDHEHDHNPEHHHEQEHEHQNEQEQHQEQEHEHHHEPVKPIETPHHHVHSRNLHDIYNIIDSSELSSFVKKTSKNIFEIIAIAEGKIHGKPIDEVHFHEVGAVDSIVDIIGAAICVELLNVDEIYCSEINLGSGFVKCEHGIFPVPAPATLEILKGVRVYSKNAKKELTTPTGAAILKVVCNELGISLDFTVEKIGYGLGKRETESPNVLRVILGTKKQNNALMMLETNIDNMNPEIYSYLFPKLLENNALDVFVTPILMKKNRPANMLSVLCQCKDVENLEEIIFLETSTLGIRKYEVGRDELKRTFKKIETPYGPVNIKLAYKNSKLVKFAPEFEECRLIAEKHHIPLIQVINRINGIAGNSELETLR